MKKVLGLLIVIMMFGSCSKSLQPKPKGLLALEFPEQEYEKLKTNCHYTFEYNRNALIKASRTRQDCMLDIKYPKISGTIYITYEPVKDNLKELLTDAQKIPLKHTIKADEIFGDEYVNTDNHTYGMLYTVVGDAASQSQFYLTDSVSHFMTGSIYFSRIPNYDSIYPAAEYLKKDLKHLMESLTWKEAD